MTPITFSVSGQYPQGLAYEVTVTLAGRLVSTVKPVDGRFFLEPLDQADMDMFAELLLRVVGSEELTRGGVVRDHPYVRDRMNTYKIEVTEPVVVVR